MKSTILFKSKGDNCYFYDFCKNSILLIHPMMYSIMNKIVIEGKDEEYEDYLYYTNKFFFLKRMGYFQNYSFSNKISKLLIDQDIINQISNTEQLTFEVTENCNLKCKYCGFGDLYIGNNRGSHDLKFDEIYPMIDFCFDLWDSEFNKSKKRKIYIGFYGGEPLLNFDVIKQIVEYVKTKDKYNRISFSMTTNAMLLNVYMTFLVENGFQLLLSIDGDEYSNSYRIRKNGKESYSQVYKNIKELSLKYPVYFKSHVNFNAVLQNRNSVSEIYFYFKNEFNKIPQISELNNYGISPVNRSSFETMFRNYEQSIFSSSNSKVLLKNLFISIPYMKDLSRFVWQYTNMLRSVNDFIKNSQMTHIPTGTCIPFSKKIFVTTRGEIYPCETIQRNYPIGSVSSKGVVIDFANIATFYNRLYEDVRKQCEICYFQNSCVQCAFNMPVNDNRIYCNTKMNLDDFVEYLSEKVSVLEANILLYVKILNQVNFR